MNFTKRIDRREAIRLAGAGLASTLTMSADIKDPQLVAKKRGEDFHGLKVGLASYSTRTNCSFSLNRTLRMPYTSRTLSIARMTASVGELL